MPKGLSTHKAWPFSSIKQFNNKDSLGPASSEEEDLLHKIFCFKGQSFEPAVCQDFFKHKIPNLCLTSKYCRHFQIAQPLVLEKAVSDLALSERIMKPEQICSMTFYRCHHISYYATLQNKQTCSL